MTPSRQSPPRAAAVGQLPEKASSPNPLALRPKAGRTLGPVAERDAWTSMPTQMMLLMELDVILPMMIDGFLGLFMGPGHN